MTGVYLPSRRWLRPHHSRGADRWEKVTGVSRQAVDKAVVFGAHLGGDAAFYFCAWRSSSPGCG